MSATIKAGLPSFDLPIPLPAPSEAKDASAIRMPKFVVYAPRIVLTEPRVTSKSALALLLRQRYPGASVKGQDPPQSRVPNYAALMYRDDERLARISEFEHLAAALKAIGEAAEGSDLLKEMHRTVWRQPTWLEDAMDRSYNGSRR